MKTILSLLYIYIYVCIKRYPIPTQFRIHPTSREARAPALVGAREARTSPEGRKDPPRRPTSALHLPHHLRHHARDRYPQASKTERETWTACPPLPGKCSEGEEERERDRGKGRERERESERSEWGREENAVRNATEREWVVAASGSPTG